MVRYKIPVTRSPKCPECDTELKNLDWFVVPLVFKCPACLRGYQVTDRPKSAGWEKVDFYFDYDKAPFPEYDDLYGGTNADAEEEG